MLQVRYGAGIEWLKATTGPPKPDYSRSRVATLQTTLKTPGEPIVLSCVYLLASEFVMGHHVEIVHVHALVVCGSICCRLSSKPVKSFWRNACCVMTIAC